MVAAALRFAAASLLQVLSYSRVVLAAAAETDNLCLVSSIFRQKAFEFCKLRANELENKNNAIIDQSKRIYFRCTGFWGFGVLLDP